MNCANCGGQIDQGNNICGSCGMRVNSAAFPSQSVNTGGGDLNGTVYQAGRDMIVNSPSSLAESARYCAVPKWRSPFTQGVLSWAGVALGIASLFPLWRIGKPIVRLVGEGVFMPDPNQVSWMFVFLGVMILFVLVLRLRRLAKYELRQPLAFDWSVSGFGRRIAFEKISAEPCPKCGGKLRFVNRPTEWINLVDVHGRRRREISERVPVLECQRNTEHRYKVDPTEHA